MSYASAYDIGLSKKPINSNLRYEAFPNVLQTEDEKPVIQYPTSGAANPKIWGPLYWYSLHNSSAHYPINASPLVKQRMKGRILAIPYEISCRICQPHASAYIETLSDSQLDNIVSARNNLFNFYVDFHNSVNQRLGKPSWTYEQASNFYMR
jgi:hypothetical protein